VAPYQLLMDERMLVQRVGAWADIFTTFSPTRALSICHARQEPFFPEYPLHGRYGRLHLVSHEKIIPHTVAALRPFNIRHIITGHLPPAGVLACLATIWRVVSHPQSAPLTTFCRVPRAQAR